MLTETEVKIIRLLQDPKRTADMTRKVLKNCIDIQSSIYSLNRKGVLLLPIGKTTEDPLADVQLTEFGKLAKVKLP